MGLDSTEKQRRKLDQLKGKGHFAEEITTNDSNNLPDVNAQLFIGTGGHIKVTLSGGSTVVLKNMIKHRDFHPLVEHNPYLL